MEDNKHQFTKINNKKVLRKIGKQWKIVSVALLMAIGGVAIANHINVNADNTNQTNTAINNSSSTQSKAPSLQNNPQSSASFNSISNNKINLETAKVYQNVLQHGLSTNTSSSTRSNSDSKAASSSYSNNYSKIYNDYYDTSYDATAGQKVVKQFNNTNTENDLSVIQSAASGVYHDFSINNQSAVNDADIKANAANQALSNANSLSYSASYNFEYSKDHNTIHSDAYDAAYMMTLANNDLMGLTASAANLNNTSLSTVARKESSLLNQIKNEASNGNSTRMLNEHQSLVGILQNEAKLNKSMSDIVSSAALANEYQGNVSAANFLNVQAGINHNEATIINTEKQINKAHMHPTPNMVTFANSEKNVANSAQSNINSLSASVNYSNIYNDYYNTSYATSATNALIHSNDVTKDSLTSAMATIDMRIQSYAMSAINHDASMNNSSALNDANAEAKAANDAWDNANDSIYNDKYQALNTIYYVTYVDNSGNPVLHKAIRSLKRAKNFVPFGYSLSKVVNLSVVNGKHVMTIRVIPEL